MNGLEIAIKMAGNQSRLAEKLGVTRQTVSVWKSRGVPLHGALAIEKRLGISMRVTAPHHFE
jgi:DNA-binding transcriptional regulator YdaS (Cro superfamily)